MRCLIRSNLLLHTFTFWDIYSYQITKRVTRGCLRCRTWIGVHTCQVNVTSILFYFYGQYLCKFEGKQIVGYGNQMLTKFFSRNCENLLKMVWIMDVANLRPKTADKKKGEEGRTWQHESHAHRGKALGGELTNVPMVRRNVIEWVPPNPFRLPLTFAPLVLRMAARKYRSHV